ncbi:T9SS type B sorting domain-containing protein [Phaeodactylibacter luteus]|uniref:T9SS type B sorting domain-containing protein n=1 Tax=Phaeodactylibacter luteus TaxID=1564516 RepID=A0A5C6RLG8_9BACT|nr:gliding motility-associated C-terminal domain-containing protein [Phaeodactylibacter luteus]TXB62805.1 T9SS type B sorting domain-containing protein [Phaeodactylibacter luteus]
MKSLSLCLLLCCSFSAAFAQFNLEVIVLGAEVETSCTDFLSAPDPLWQVEVNGQGRLTYPLQTDGCFNALPNLQYNEPYACGDALPTEVQVCFYAFENDPIIPFGCIISPDCLEQACAPFAVPAHGDTVFYTLPLPSSGATTGELSFAVTVSGPGNNDLPCDAVGLGLLVRGDTIGDAGLGQFSNLCANNQNEPDPADEGAGFSNQNGVWFEFTTGPDIGSVLWIEVLGDPEGTGDNFDAEVAVYRSDNGNCDGSLELVSWSAPTDRTDVYMRLSCPEPDTRYFVLVDGAFSSPGSEEGVFGISLNSTDVDEAPDNRCDALSLGAVPTGGAVATGQPYSNFCATSVGDPFSPSFVVQASVWFSFQAPPTGHVLIEAIADTLTQPLGAQLSLYRPFSTCSGFFQHIASNYTFEDRDESLQVSCLYPGETYYVLVDGDGGFGRGIFSLQVSDAGDITPRTTVDTTICAGSAYEVGSSTYTQAGTYSDTLSLFQGCDSIVMTNLTVLEPIVLNIEQLQPGVGEGNANGIAQASASGGAGGYTFSWCNGTSGPLNESLVGGIACCLTVTDSQGCTTDTCFTPDLLNNILPTVLVEDALCQGSATGTISFSVLGGLAPYDYTWAPAGVGAGGTGILAADNEVASLAGLGAGAYSLTVTDGILDTVFTVEVQEPAPLAIVLEESAGASCFGFCDGRLQASPIGGVQPYSIEWEGGGNGPSAEGLCAGSYALTVTDGNGCVADTFFAVQEPAELIGTVEVLQEVSCFGGGDGRLAVSGNEAPLVFEWSNGGAAAIIEGLSAGTYEVTLTNASGCQDTLQAFLPQPVAPFTADIALAAAISCSGDSDGALEALPGGPFQSVAYTWSNGSGGAQVNGLAAGAYGLTLTNERGCRDSAVYNLSEPGPLQPVVSVVDITCLSPENGGVINFDTVVGGTPPYEYAVDGVLFASSPKLAGLFAGVYTVVVRDSAGCEAELEQLVAPAPELLVFAGPDEEIRLGDTVILQAQASSATAVFEWAAQDSSGLFQSASEWGVSPKLSTLYRVVAVDTVSQCRAEDEVWVRVSKERQVFLPNAFSPNGDGQNDEFLVFAGNDVAEVGYLRVFSRGGQMVFEGKNLDPNVNAGGWDGNFRGQQMPAGVYAFVAAVRFKDGETEVYSGEVVLMR